MSAPPRCLHGTIWNVCDTCARMTWCEDCGAKIELDKPLHPRETITCERCVDRVVGRVA